MNTQNTPSPVGHMNESFFAHPSEKRTAVMLDANNVGYIYRFRVTAKKKDKIIETEIDFFLLDAINVRGHGLVKHIENKNRKSIKAENQQNLLKDNGYETLIVTTKMLDDFERNGFMEGEKRHL
ncbi:MAG: hypothetical protein HYR95_01840 [Candidatus Colwellbacteria bacterium]|nr:hypothetical protein [Candidatus Colwellbacteria bacterium]